MAAMGCRKMIFKWRREGNETKGFISEHGGKEEEKHVFTIYRRPRPKTYWRMGWCTWGLLRIGVKDDEVFRNRKDAKAWAECTLPSDVIIRR
jgi:hypothetical protein